MALHETETSGLLAEFATPELLVAAVRAARRTGLTLMEAFTPFPVPAVEEALALAPSRISRVVFAAAVTGALFAYGLQYWVAAVAYPLNVGATPLHSGPAFIPITFETTVLFGSIAAFISLFAFTGLPRLWHPVFEVRGFESATLDRFWLGIDGRDPRYDAASTQRLLVDAGALRIVPLEPGS
jgi:hypothetical protein